MKKAILSLLLLMSSLSYSSWWGGLDGGTRAAIVTGSALILGSQYNQSEYRHQQDLRRLDTQIRRGYERQAVIENANRKYSNVGAPGYLYENPRPVQQNYNQGYNSRGGSRARIIYSDQRSQILEMADGTRIVINQ
ncbi:hypothetical protein [Cetobacterium sp. ZWU0022]|uniref:hypothetical protein n=1 Tax=Cetobacterium sp. ZWU0022 TaxID=1340502 RepID=UPI00064825AE|nr:hypothetical protein [Cetobacterium sp. ZWU0022]